MNDRRPINFNAVIFIKSQVTTLSAVILLMVLMTFLVVVKLIYNVLDYLPMNSLLMILAIMAVLAAVVILVAKAISGRALAAIESYSGSLNSLLHLQKEIHEAEHSDVVLNHALSSAKQIAKSSEGALLIPQKDGIHVWTVEGVPPPPSIASLRLDTDSASPPASPALARANCMVPFKLGASGAGTIVLAREQDRPFAPEEVEMVEFISDFASRVYEAHVGREKQKAYAIQVASLLVGAMECKVEKAGHSGRVANYAMMLAGKIGMDDERKARLHKAALLHDIGYLRLSSDCFLSNEFTKHAEYGAQILRDIDCLCDMPEAVLYHHERWNGTGYPSGLSGKDIPLESRIIAIAEAFDAMVMGKSYGQFKRLYGGMHKSVDGVDEAIAELKRLSGLNFDPELVKEFADAIDVDTVHELSSHGASPQAARAETA